MRVLHINAGNLYGGVETYLVTLARCKDRCAGMEPAFALCQEGRLSQELRASGVPVHILGTVRMSRPWTVWRARRRLREILTAEPFDFVLCHMPWSYAVFAKSVRNSGRRLGFCAHAFHSGRGWLERLARRTRPDLAIANSRFTERGLSNLFPGVPSGIVHPPVALANYEQAAQWRAAVRREQGVAPDCTVIVQVSRLEPLKGHLLHLEALSRLKTAPSRWVCWFVGGPQKTEEQQYLLAVQHKASELGLADRVRFLGQRSDISQVLAGADIFCQPNHAPESFGIAFVEALWAGKPVITTRMGGALEIVDESCGVVVEPGDAGALAASLERLIESEELRLQFGRAGKARAVFLCDPAKQMRSLYELSSTVALQH